MMKFPIITQKDPLMKALTMDEYADFVWFFMKDADAGKVYVQKSREERISKPFSLSDDIAKAKQYDS